MLDFSPSILLVCRIIKGDKLLQRKQMSLVLLFWISLWIHGFKHMYVQKYLCVCVSIYWSDYALQCSNCPIFGQWEHPCPFDMTPVTSNGFLADLTRCSRLLLHSSWPKSGSAISPRMPGHLYILIHLSFQSPPLMIRSLPMEHSCRGVQNKPLWHKNYFELLLKSLICLKAEPPQRIQLS